MTEAKRTYGTCSKKKPESKFLPSLHHDGGRLDKCLDCIRKAAEAHRVEREAAKKTAALEPKNALVVRSPAALPTPPVPMKGRMAPELEQAARRFVIGRRDGGPLPESTNWSPSCAACWNGCCPKRAR